MQILYSSFFQHPFCYYIAWVNEIKHVLCTCNEEKIFDFGIDLSFKEIEFECDFNRLSTTQFC